MSVFDETFDPNAPYQGRSYAEPHPVQMDAQGVSRADDIDNARLLPLLFIIGALIALVCAFTNMNLVSTALLSTCVPLLLWAIIKIRSKPARTKPSQ